MTESTALTTATQQQAPGALSFLHDGQRRIEAAMALLAECHASGIWPGYGDLVQEPIELPGWCRD